MHQNLLTYIIPLVLHDNKPSSLDSRWIPPTLILLLLYSINTTWNHIAHHSEITSPAKSVLIPFPKKSGLHRLRLRDSHAYMRTCVRTWAHLLSRKALCDLHRKRTLVCSYSMHIADIHDLQAQGLHHMGKALTHLSSVSCCC